MRAQNESLRGPPWGCGAFKLLPVAALYLARPLAVKPAPLDTGNFSPRPTASDGPFFLGAALAIDDFQARLVYVLQQWHDNLFAEVAGKFIRANVRQADVYVNMDFEAHARSAITE